MERKFHIDGQALYSSSIICIAFLELKYIGSTTAHSFSSISLSKNLWQMKKVWKIRRLKDTEKRQPQDMQDSRAEVSSSDP